MDLQGGHRRAARDFGEWLGDRAWPHRPGIQCRLLQAGHRGDRPGPADPDVVSRLLPPGLRGCHRHCSSRPGVDPRQHRPARRHGLRFPRACLCAGGIRQLHRAGRVVRLAQVRGLSCGAEQDAGRAGESRLGGGDDERPLDRHHRFRGDPRFWHALLLRGHFDPRSSASSVRSPWPISSR